MLVMIFSQSSIPEFRWISQFLPEHLPEEVLLGIGDDAAILKQTDWVVAQDLFIEGSHFQAEWYDGFSWVEKAFRVNLSDMNAMGTKGELVMIAVGMGKSWTSEQRTEFGKAIGKSLKNHNLIAVGGDTALSETPFLGLTLFGKKPKFPLLRSGLQEGWGIYHSGLVGAAHVGWKVLERYGLSKARSLSKQAVDQQTCPEIDLELGPYLGKNLSVVGMDLSDSLGDTLLQLCADTKFDFQIDLSKVSSFSQMDLCFPEKNPKSILQCAEDYGLLLAAPKDRPEIQSLCADSRLFQIGTVNAGGGSVWFRGEQGLEKILSEGHRHF